MVRRRDFIKPGQESFELARRIKIEAWKQFFQKINISEKNKPRIKESLEIFLNRFIGNLNFNLRPIAKSGFRCERSSYEFFGREIDCWRITLIITEKEIDYDHPFKITIRIFVDENNYYNSEAYVNHE